MLEVLFNDLPRHLFEPIYYMGLVGIIAALWYWKRANRLVIWWVAIAIFMLGWRILAHINSGRYGALMIYPLLLGCVAIFAVLFSVLKSHCHNGGKKYLKIVRILIAIGYMALIVGCLLKSLRLNPYSDTLIKMSKILVEEMAHERSQGNYPIILTVEQARLSHYTQDHAVFAPPRVYATPNFCSPQLLANFIVEFQYSGSVIFLLISESAKDASVEFYLSQIKHLKVKKIMEGFTDSREKRIWRLWRIETQSIMYEINNMDEIKSSADDNLIVNPGFQEELNQADTLKSGDDFNCNFNQPDFRLPAYWSNSQAAWPKLRGWHNFKIIHGDESISGGSSFYMQSDYRYYQYPHQMFTLGKYMFSFLFRASENTQFSIIARLYDSKRKHFKTITLSELFVPRSGTYRVALPIDERLLTDCSYFRIGVAIGGGNAIVVDDFCLTAVK